MRIVILFFFLSTVGCMTSRERHDFGRTKPDTTFIDPEEEQIRQVINKKDNPCKDSLYMVLKKIPLDSMSQREYEYYILKEKECSEYRKIVYQTDPQKQIAQQYSDNSTFLIILIVTLVVSGLTLWILNK